MYLCPHYNMVPVKRQWCPVAGKVTVGVASHWPCITDFSCLPTYTMGSGPNPCLTQPTILMRYGILYDFNDNTGNGLSPAGAVGLLGDGIGKLLDHRRLKDADGDLTQVTRWLGGKLDDTVSHHVRYVMRRHANLTCQPREYTNTRYTDTSSAEINKGFRYQLVWKFSL